MAGSVNWRKASGFLPRQTQQPDGCVVLARVWDDEEGKGKAGAWRLLTGRLPEETARGRTKPRPRSPDSGKKTRSKKACPRAAPAPWTQRGGRPGHGGSIPVLSTANGGEERRRGSIARRRPSQAKLCNWNPNSPWVFFSEALVEEGIEDGNGGSKREIELGLLDWIGQGEKSRREMPRLLLTWWRKSRGAAPRSVNR
jgi:hypothetical protein